MSRWLSSAGETVETPKVDAFLEEIFEVCRRHGYSIGHEDIGGSFIISHYDGKADEAWLAAASIDDTIPEEKW